MKIKLILLTTLFLAFSSIGFAQSNSAPGVVVKDLYAAHENQKADPFNQDKNRALLDKYFTKEFADLIWKETVTAYAHGDAAIDFDPLYNAQDTKIAAFKIGKADYGEVNRKVADVAVTFKNFGKAQTILFRLEEVAGVGWRISDIHYPSNPADGSSLKDILANALKEESADSAASTSQDGTRIRFKHGSSSTTVSGTVAKGGPDFYIVRARGLQKISIQAQGAVTFGVDSPTSGKLTGDDSKTSWSETLPEDGNFRIGVYSKGGVQKYSLTVSIH